MASGTIKAVASKADISALNDQIAPVAYTVSSLSAFQTNLDTLLATMSNGETRNVFYNPTSAFAPFGNREYCGTLHRRTSTTAVCYMYYATEIIQGYKNGSTWTFTSLSDQIATSVKNATIESTYKRTDSTVIKMGNLCIFSLGNLKGLTVDTAVTIGTLPSDCLPSALVSGTGQYGGNYVAVTLRTNGEIDVTCHEQNCYVSCMIAYKTT